MKDSVCGSQEETILFSVIKKFSDMKIEILKQI